MKTTGIIDYGMGNIGSVLNILRKIGKTNGIVITEPEEISGVDHIILPGVGAFDKGIQSINEKRLGEAIHDFARKDKPILGICLGMQLLGNGSEEGREKGLELIPFHCERFRLESPFKIPHMGWEYVSILDKKDPMVDGMIDEQRYYFVHSYHAVCDDSNTVLMSCDYGYDFAASVRKGYIYGVQFHPEKSHKYGIQLLRNFVNL